MKHSTFNIQLSTFICALMIATGGLTLTGCSTTPQTREAVVYKSFRTTWSVALRAHDVYCERAVLGKVKAADMANVDAAWDKFRAVFKVWFTAAQRDWTMPTPRALAAAEKELLDLIRSL